MAKENMSYNLAGLGLQYGWFKTSIIAMTVLTARIHIDLNRQFGGSSPTLGSSALGYKPGLEVQRLHLEFKFS